MSTEAPEGPAALLGGPDTLVRGDEAPPPPPAPRSLREEAEADLQLALWVLVALTLLLLPVWYLMTWSQPAAPGDSLPAGVHISDTAALALDEEEAARFDASVFGGIQGGELPTALGDLRLPPRVPTLTERPWLLASRADPAAPGGHQGLDALRACTETPGCDPRQGEVLSEALAAVSVAAGDGSGPCSSAPRTGADGVQVPIGLHALVLAYLPECREQARQRFALLAEKIALNIKAGALRPPQSVAASLYARFGEAKLAEGPRQPGGPAFLKAVRSMRQDILASAALREPWQRLQELPAWGLSMAEIQAEWLMAEAREQARQGRGAGLAPRLAPLLDPHVYVQLRAAPALSVGQGRLRLTWCALALRARLPEGASDFCLGALAHAVSLPSMHCAAVARSAIVAGRWEVSGSDCSGDADSAPETSASSVFERMARSHLIWSAVLTQYLQGGMDTDERARLGAYLAAYAGPSHSTLRWFWVRHPRAFVIQGVGFVVLLVGWVAWAWASLVRRRSLHRFLPAPLEMD